MSTTDTLTTGQIARYCNVNVRTVIGWIERKLLHAYKLPGRRGDHRVPTEAFVTFLQAHDMPIPAELRSRAQRVLVVDDDSSMANSIARLLIGTPFEVKTVNDGFNAGLALASFEPAVMTLDLRMPGLDGFAVLRELRESKRPVKVLVVSALDQEQLEKALEAGADDTLEKPFEDELLLEKIRRLMDAP